MKFVLFIARLLIKRKAYKWFRGYLRQQKLLKNIDKSKVETIDVMLVIVDHFEPSRKEGALGVQKVREWCEQYEELAIEHQDSDGIFPQHTWFYRYDYPNYECVKILSEYAYKDFGEIEFHLHHGYDTPDSLSKTIHKGIEWFNKTGAMISAESSPQMRFGYIAGNWALDNGAGDPTFSGVNDELSLLAQAGCYADFIFPAFASKAQPRKVNSIYYATSRPLPKSYNSGIDIETGKEPSGDLMIFQGPLYVDWMRGFLEHAAFEFFTPYKPERVDYWLRAGVHVRGRPEWVFVKLHTHGMQSKDVVLSNQLSDMLYDLEKRFKVPPFHLHYVTAREAYNISKAAEAGEGGDPNIYRNFVIAEPVNKKMFCNRPYVLEKYSRAAEPRSRGGK